VSRKKKQTREFEKTRYPGVYRRRGRYAINVSIPGTRQKATGTYDSLQEASHAAAEVRARGARARVTRRTVAQFAEDWLSRYPRLKPGSNRTARSNVKPFVKEFGGFRLDQLPRDRLRDWGRNAATRGQVAAASALIGDAIDSGYAETNHLSKLNLKSAPGRANIEVITREELHAVADTARRVMGDDFGPTIQALILWSGYTGLRPGETLAMRPGNIIANTDEIEVLENRDKSGVLLSPKNHQTRRVWLPKRAKAAIAWLPVNDTGFVFLNKRGKPMSYSSLTGYWHQVRAAHAVHTGEDKWRTATFYEFRHSCASWMLNDLGLEPKLVAHQLGHTGKTGVDLVLRLYGHPESSRYNRAAAEAEERAREAGS